jgi:hypothetical protein
MGLVDDVHMYRICNAYEKRIWNVLDLPVEGFPLWMRVDGSGEEDYTRLSRGWVKLAAYVPEIYEKQRIALGIHQQRHGFDPAGFEVEAIAQLLHWDGELKSTGMDPSEFEVVGREHLEKILDDAYERLDRTASFGVETDTIEGLLNEAAELVNTGSLENASVPIAMIWVAWDGMTDAIQTGEELELLENETLEAGSIGADIDDILDNISLLWAQMTEVWDFAPIKNRIEQLKIDLSRVITEALIAQADEVVETARERGIDTSRHEIYLRRAHEEFDKGNYQSARSFTEFPLRLKVDVGEISLISILLVSIPLLIRRCRETL